MDVKELISTWSSVRSSKAETPLAELTEALSAGSEKYRLQQTRNNRGNWMIWDVEANSCVLATHAFVVKYCFPMQTGNFVPFDSPIPLNLPEKMARTEQSQAEWIVTFDAHLDKDLCGHIKVLDKWGRQHSELFNPRAKPRNPYQSPAMVKEKGNLAMGSHLFEKRTPYNAREDGYKVNYPVHDWIAKASVPHNPTWTPNPNLARVLEMDDDENLIKLSDSSNPSLVRGDLVKAVFKIVFNATRATWTMKMDVVVVIRVGHIESEEGDTRGLSDDAIGDLPQEGQKFQRFSGVASEVDAGSASSRDDDKASVEDSTARPTRYSPDWDLEALYGEDVSDVEEERPVKGASGASNENDARSSIKKDGSGGTSVHHEGANAKRKLEDEIDSKKKRMVPARRK